MVARRARAHVARMPSTRSATGAPSAPSDRRAPADAHVVVVGGGISGLSAAERLTREDAAVRVTVLEGAPRLGGPIQTERRDGFVLELGPDVVVASKPATRALCERLGIGHRLHGTNPAARGAYVLRGGRLHRLPPGLSGLMPTRLLPFIASGLLSPAGKTRVLAEPLVPGRVHGPEESVAEFVTRRLGREMYERLVEPLLTGIYAGDGTALSLAATFPQLAAMERSHGGLLRGVRAARVAAEARAEPAGSVFLSLPTGMHELVEALERRLAATGRVTIRRRTQVRAVEPDGAGGARVRLADGETLEADAVVVATPAHAAAELLRDADVALAAELEGIPHTSTAIVTLAYDAASLPRRLDATGYVVPRVERREVMACTWSSTKFLGRAPADAALVRLFLGGAHHAHVVDEDETALVARARAELRETLGLEAAPRFSRVVRWERGMPQYHRGHRERVARVEARIAARHGWLALAGNAYHGVGIPDCIRSGERAAERALAAVASGAGVAAAVAA
jgi:oxygen-dependent protoporphyrinogen oxidase